ncbi:MAG: beta-1-3, beta-1-6-glucan biosynthesis protein [Pseudomonadota bacterium]
MGVSGGRVSGVSRGAVLRLFALPAVALLIGMAAASAQSSGPQADQSQNAKAAADASKDGQRKTDEFVEAAKTINGPAGNPECVWLGRRIVSLMWRDDLDTAFRHLDLYDRFGCPGGHVQATFRCLVRFGGQIDPKVAETLNGRVHACWINPNAQPQGVTVPVLPSPPAAPEKPEKK